MTAAALDGDGAPVPLPRAFYARPHGQGRARSAGQVAGAPLAGCAAADRAHRRGRGLPGRARRRLARAARADSARGDHVRAAGFPLRLPDLRHVQLHELRHRGGRGGGRGADPRRRTRGAAGRRSRSSAEWSRQAVSRPGHHARAQGPGSSPPAASSTSPTAAARGHERLSPRASASTTRATGRRASCASSSPATRTCRASGHRSARTPGSGLVQVRILRSSRSCAFSYRRRRCRTLGATATDLGLERREHARQRRGHQTVGDLAQDDARHRRAYVHRHAVVDARTRALGREAPGAGRVGDNLTLDETPVAPTARRADM